jgi:hypothetical protein
MFYEQVLWILTFNRLLKKITPKKNFAGFTGGKMAGESGRCGLN